MDRRAFLVGGATALVNLPLPSLAQSERSRVLKFVPQADLAITDPYRTTAYVTRNHGYLVYDTLFGIDESFQIKPQMVEGYVVENDGKLWKLTLRSGLRFHDGSQVLASDVVASLKRWGGVDGFGQSLFDATDEMSAPSDNVVQFRLKRPFPLLPAALAKLPGYMPAIMPARVIPKEANQAVTEIIGSGPYRFIAGERVQGARFVYEKFKDYVPRQGEPASRTAGAKVPYMDRVEWHIMPDAATASAALQSGEVDWIEAPLLDLVPALKSSRGVKVELKDTIGNIGVLRPNHMSKPFDNPAIRRVLLSAIKQADFMTAVAGVEPGSWAENVGFFCPKTPEAENLPPLPSATVEESKKALIAAGYKGEPVVFLAATDYPALNAMSQVGAELMREIGFNVDYQAVDWGTVQQRRSSQSPVGQGGWSVFVTFTAGVDTFNPAVNHSLRGNGVAAPAGWPKSEKLESLRDQWFSASDDKARQDVSRRIQAQAAEDVPYIPLGQFFQPSAYRDSVSGILSGFATFYNVKKA